MARETPFYLREEFLVRVRTDGRFMKIVRREIDRVLLRDPEGEDGRYEAARYALALIGAGLILGVAATAPGAVYGLKLLRSFRFPDRRARKLQKYQQLKRTIERLRKQRLISFSRKRGSAFSLSITLRGQARLIGYAFGDFAIPQPDTWDKRWRLVIFDIPETKKTARDVLRRKLHNMGFLQLQKSVFVYPYPCEEEIDVIASVFSLWPYLTFLETESLGRQEPEARKHFDLF